MRPFTILILTAGVLWTSGHVAAQQARVRQHGRAIMEYSAPDVKAVAAYEYSRQHHDTAWLLVELAVVAKERIAIHRDQIRLVTPEEGRSVRVASQEQFLEDHEAINKLLQNAVVSRRPLDSYFTTRPQPTIRFFSFPGRTVSDSFVTNQDEVAAGDVLFRSPDGTWAAGTYRLVIDHEKAKAEIPITLE
jgi:hypothetical protein